MVFYEPGIWEDPHLHRMYLQRFQQASRAEEAMLMLVDTGVNDQVALATAAEYRSIEVCQRERAGN